MYLHKCHAVTPLAHNIRIASASLTQRSCHDLPEKYLQEKFKARCGKLLTTATTSDGTISLNDQIRSAMVLKQILMVDVSVGVWCLNQDNAMKKVCMLARYCCFVLCATTSCLTPCAYNGFMLH